MHKIGIDLGGTKIEGICLDENLNIIQRKRIPTNQQNGYHGIVDSITVLVNEISKKRHYSASFLGPFLQEIKVIILTVLKNLVKKH